ncbi:MAG TPA: MFS transporter, partial [Pyrinomonadaceae bacterium]
GWGEQWCFFVNSASFIPAVVGILLMKEIPENKSKPERSTLLFNVVEGFKIVSGHSIIRNVLLLTALLGLVGMSFTVLLPVLSGQILQAGPSGLGQLVGAAGGGALLASLSFTGYRNSKGLGHWIIVSSIIFGFGLIFLSLSDSFRISTALLFILGFSQVVQLDSANKLLQSIVSDHLRGRVMSFYILVLMGLTPFGTLAAGWLAAYIGVLPTMAICGALYLVFAVIVVIRLLQHIRAEQAASRLYSVSQSEALR